MKTITLIASGKARVVRLEKLFDTYGPWTIEGQRVDQLKDVVLLSESSTSTFTESGTGLSKTSTAGVVGRSLVGGVLAGGVGAVVGGATAGRKESYQAVTTEKKIFDMTVSLEWMDGVKKIAKLDSPEDLRWLVSYVGQPEMTGEGIEEDKKSYAEEQLRLSVWREVDNDLPKQTSNEEMGGAFGLLAFGAFAVYGILTGGFWKGIGYSLIGFVAGMIAMFVAMFIQSNREDKRKVEREALFEKILATKKNREESSFQGDLVKSQNAA